MVTSSNDARETWLHGLGRELKRCPEELIEVDPSSVGRRPDQVWASRKFLVQIFEDDFFGPTRITVCRTKWTRLGWKADITWDELQWVKDSVGFANRDAVEIYPARKDIINEANMRHLWVCPEPLDFAWRA